MDSTTRARLPEYWIPQDLKDVLGKKENIFGSKEKRDMFTTTLEKLSNVDRLELSECHYLQLLKLGLYLEEFQSATELKMYSMYGKKIEKMNTSSLKTFKINLENVEKDSPLHKSQVRLIEVVNSKDTGSRYILRVKEILEDHIVADAFPEFCKIYKPDASYNISFRVNNYTFRCSHYALSTVYSQQLTSRLYPKFPDGSLPPTKEALVVESEQVWFNKQILENPEQKKAVTSMINKSSYPAPYILYGPPGTGKTATLAEAVTQIWARGKEKIIICTPSNAAADEITRRLLKHIPSREIDRIYSKSRDCSLIDADLKECSNFSGNTVVKLNPQVVSARRIIISTLITCCKLLFMDIWSKYSYVFIDEAGQSSEPDSLIAFNIICRHGADKCQIVLSGDPLQLGPSVKSKYATPILGQSILERLMKTELYKKSKNNAYNTDYITKLVRNYRSHSAIIRVSNELYYEKELVACGNKQAFVNEYFKSDFPIIFHAVKGSEQKEKGNPSSYNAEEIKKVLEYVQMFVGEKIGDKEIAASDIGVITPFALQSKNLRESLKQHHLSDVAVGTIEIFQGQEKEVIIISTVRTKIFTYNERKHIGFLSNPRRFNVALTRAKSNLVVVGDPQALQTDYHWQYFINFCQENNACRGDKFELISGVDRLSMLINSLDIDQTFEQSIDLFPKSFKILNINDGIIRIRRKKPALNGANYDEQMCTIL